MIVLNVVVALGLCGADTTRRRDMAAQSEEYLLTALALLEEHAVNRADVDWRSLRIAAFDNASGAAVPGQTHYAILTVIEAIGNPHTFLVPARLRANVSEVEPELPHARLSADGRIAVVTVPNQNQRDPEKMARYVRAGADAVQAMDSARPCGWIVDLRTNTGGSVGHMLAVLAPLLKDGPLGSAIGPNYVSHWYLENGHFRLDGRSIAHNPTQLTAMEPPVALLTSSETASAAEATLIAFRGLDRARTFGQPTAGRATNNVPFELADGSLLAVTNADFVDPTGRRYGNVPIPPDHPTVDPESAAIAWLANQPSCRSTTGHR